MRSDHRGMQRYLFTLFEVAWSETRSLHNTRVRHLWVWNDWRMPTGSHNDHTNVVLVRDSAKHHGWRRFWTTPWVQQYLTLDPSIQPICSSFEPRSVEYLPQDQTFGEEISIGSFIRICSHQPRNAAVMKWIQVDMLQELTSVLVVVSETTLYMGRQSRCSSLLRLS